MSDDELEIEADAIDLLTDSMFSLDFLKKISDEIFSENRDKISVGQFYDEWLKSTGRKDHKIPFNLGSVLGYIYCGILWAKEKWFDLLPDIKLNDLNEDWGIKGITYISPKNADPNLKYVVRRLRNALGHGNVKIDLPKDVNDKSELMDRTSLEFHDINVRDNNDIFDTSLTLNQLVQFVKKFQSIIHKDVRERKNKT